MMLTCALFLSCLASTGFGSSDLTQFERFKADHGKSYSPDEEALRSAQSELSNVKVLKTFSEGSEFSRATSGRSKSTTVGQVRMKSKSYQHEDCPGVSWRMAVTQFADLTEEQFVGDVLGGYIRTPQAGHQGHVQDWRSYSCERFVFPGFDAYL